MVGVDVELQGGFQRGQSFLRQPAVLQQSLAPDNEIIGRKDIQKGGKGLPAPADVLRRVPVAGIGLDPLKKDGIGQLLPTVFRRAVFPAAKHGFNIADVADPVVAFMPLALSSKAVRTTERTKLRFCPAGAGPCAASPSMTIRGAATPYSGPI